MSGGVSGWEQIARAPRFSLITDLDGSLVPFEVVPARAMPSAEVIEILAALAAIEGTAVVVASGRTKRDLERSFGAIDAIDLVAEHGLFIRESGVWRVTASASETPFRRLEAELRDTLFRFPGAAVEHKALSIALHGRAVAPELKPALYEEAGSLVDSIVAKHEGLERLDGNEVIEVRLAGVSKAEAVTLVRRKLGADAPIVCIGDDVTDEDMFRAVGDGGIAIRVGDRKHPTAATVHLSDPLEAIGAIAKLLEIRRAG